MSDLTAAIQSIKSEVKIDDQGRVSMTRNGMCLLLGISRSSLNVREMPLRLAKNLADTGFDCVREIGDSLPETAVSTIIHYYAVEAKVKSEVAAQLLKTMTAIGIRAFFQHQLGWAEQKPANSVKSLRESVEAATKWIDAMEFAESKPGEKNILEYASEPQNQKSLGGFLTLKQMVASIAPDLVPNLKASDWKHIGSFAAVTYRNIYGKAPDYIYEKRETEAGIYYPKTPVYPVDFSPYVQNVLELGYLS